MRRLAPLAALVLAACASGAAAVGSSAPTDTAEWAAYNGGPGGEHYSTLASINRSNVGGLSEAWRFETGPGALQTNPLVVGRTLYGFTPGLNVVALDAATGARKWSFDPGIPAPQPSRGFAYWNSGGERRLLAGIMNRLYALDPDTGRPIAGFGRGGFVDLREGLGADPESLAVYLTTPGVVFGDVVIVGFRTSEAPPAAPGAIRAYDVRTGALRWTFNTIPNQGQPGAETWPATSDIPPGAANAWSGLAVDAQRGIVFAATGSAVPDFYGADRKGDDLYANTLIALDATTGRRLWHFQAVHHDIWDRDFPSPPVLVTVRRDGRSVDAVAQAGKQGVLFLFERATGRPLFPIEERAVRPSDVPGEAASPTQPFPLKPAPFARQRLTEDMLTRRTPAAHAWALDQFSRFISAGPFTPLSVDRQTVVFPGFDGGAEWGGSAVDPEGMLYINANDLPWTGGLTANGSDQGVGESIYQNQCAACHGADRKGFPPAFPDLSQRTATMSAAEVEAVLRSGKGRMPAFPIIVNRPGLAELIHYVKTGSDPAPRSDRAEAAPVAAGPQSAYVFTGFRKFLDPEGYPAVEPPWGTLSAIDLNSGEYRWQIPLGEYPELAAQGMTGTGTENYGGPLATAGGLVIIGATNFDSRLRAFDARDGRLLWEGALPYAGNATPATYMIDGRQYVVIAASNGRNPLGPQGSAYVAFALPDR